MATKINMDRYVWEGWTVGAFIRELAPQVNSHFARMYNLK